MEEAFNAKRAQYDMKRRLNEKSRESIIDLTEADRMQRLHDIIEEERRRNRPNATSELMESTVRNRETESILSTINESNAKGGDLIDYQDEYEKYDPEPFADQQLINSGATIIDSRIEVTDFSGRHRILVRREGKSDGGRFG